MEALKRFAFAAFLAFTGCAGKETGFARRPPNVVLVITDDQGYGDLGCHGNPQIRTPHVDAFAKESIELERFHVCPVCSPTRSSLLTGRYNYRTGVVDTSTGRSMMYPDEVTLAEMLAAAGYRTGIFGKWHLGDNYPMRAMDQGFQEALTLKGGGIGQPTDPPGGDRYQDPTLDALIDRFFVTIPRPERMQVLGQIIQQMTDQVQMIGLFFDGTPTLMARRISGVTPRQQGWNAHEWDLQA